MRPDVVVAWPRHVEFPLWRAWLASNRLYLGRVMVAFIEQHLPEDWREYARREFDRIGGVTTLDAPRLDGQDWRDTAVNECLDKCESDWIWFTEPDFLIWDDPAFRKVVSALALLHGAIGFRERGDDRWHPACMIVKRNVVDQTSRYFGADPVDHFWAFGKEVAEITPFGDLTDFLAQSLLACPVDFTHIGGLSRNEQLVDNGSYEEVRYPKEHARYLKMCLEERCHPVWRERSEDFIRWAKTKSEFV